MKGSMNVYSNSSISQKYRSVNTSSRAESSRAWYGSIVSCDSSLELSVQSLSRKSPSLSRSVGKKNILSTLARRYMRDSAYRKSSYHEIRKKSVNGITDILEIKYTRTYIDTFPIEINTYSSWYIRMTLEYIDVWCEDAVEEFFVL